MNKPTLTNHLTLAFLLAFMPVPSLHAENNEIRLILQITVDGLRADLLSRYSDRFGEGGFRLLKNNGTIFANAHYQHANTETIVGHTTLATGAHPSVHGMTGNVWFDAEAKELAYNIEDANAPILQVRKKQMIGDQVDPHRNWRVAAVVRHAQY